jgi:hypothetical protein
MAPCGVYNTNKAFLFTEVHNKNRVFCELALFLLALKGAAVFVALQAFFHSATVKFQDILIFQKPVQCNVLYMSKSIFMS